MIESTAAPVRCVGCGESWPCWYSKNAKSYSPAALGVHAPNGPLPAAAETAPVRMFAAWSPVRQCWLVCFGRTVATASVLSLGSGPNAVRSWPTREALVAECAALGLVLGADNVVRTARGDA